MGLGSADMSDLEDKLKLWKKEMELKAGEAAHRQMKKLLQDRVQSDILLEGRAAAFTVEMEKKLLGKIDAYAGELVEVEKERSTTFEKLSHRMDDCLVKINAEYEEKVLGAAKKEAEMETHIVNVVNR